MMEPHTQGQPERPETGESVFCPLGLRVCLAGVTSLWGLDLQICTMMDRDLQVSPESALRFVVLLPCNVESLKETYSSCPPNSSLSTSAGWSERFTRPLERDRAFWMSGGSRRVTTHWGVSMRPSPHPNL
jgi:hypothetical protein